MTFGREIRGLDPQRLLSVEYDAERSERFGEIDALLAGIVTASFAGKSVVEVGFKAAKNMTRSDSVEIVGLSAAHAQMVRELYSLERQQSRGAWFLPQSTSLKAGICNLPGMITRNPRFATNAVRDATAEKVDLETNEHALAVWALLIPFYSAIFAPVEARTTPAKPTAVDPQEKRWSSIENTYLALNLDVTGLLADMRPGGNWARLDINGQVVVKQKFVAALVQQVVPNTFRRWRATLIQELVAKYYSKAGSGPPLARSVIAGSHQTTLCGYFGGDWLDFLDYLGEAPNEAENVLTSLPEPRIYLGGSSRKAQVAAASGVAMDELERMLGALLGRNTGGSAVEERVAVMRRWWQAIDSVHAAQQSRRKPPRGLVEDGFVLASGQIPAPGLYRQLLPRDLCSAVERLWNGVVLTRWPERIVSEIFPHNSMAKTFGSAIDLWNGVAILGWSACDTYTNKNLSEIGARYAEEARELADLGFAVDGALFEELADAEAHLGPPQPWAEGWDRRRDGFETVRNIVTSHRRAWADLYLDDYLRHRWSSELNEVSREFSRSTAARGKPPTFKQFAKFAVVAANHWFGGDLAAVYAAIGESSPESTSRCVLLIGDSREFMHAVEEELGDLTPAVTKAGSGRIELERLAAEAPRYLQLFEAMGRSPSFREFGAARFRWELLDGDEIGWRRYQAAIEAALKRPES